MAKQQKSAVTSGAGFLASVWGFFEGSAKEQGLTGEDLHFLATDGARTLAEPIGKAIAQIVAKARKKLDLNGFFTTRDGLYVWDEFQKWIVAAATSSDTIVTTKSTAYDLPRGMNDAEIRAALGDGHVFEDPYVFCVMLAKMIDEQRGGTSGTLLNNGYANLFYVRGVQGEVFTVYVRWDAGYRGWDVRAFRLAYVRWSAGYRAFSSNC